MKLLKLLALFALLAASSVFAQVTIPDTPAGKVLTAWLTSFNSADTTQLLAFDKLYKGDEFSIENKLAFHRTTGGLILIRIEKNEPLYLEVLLKDVESANVGNFRISVSGDTPTKIIADNIRLVATPNEFLPARMTEIDAIASTIANTDSMSTNDKFSGTILLAHDGKILLERAWGYADREHGKWVSLNTLFGIGSMNKMFTSVAVLQLVENGKLKLDNTIAEILPDYPNKLVANSVTIRALLTHTGAVGDIFGPEFDAHKDSLRDHSDYIKFFGNRALVGEVGKYQYSNYGFVLLGAIIERLSGISYYDYVEMKIFRPSGMGSTGSLPETTTVTDRAIGYTASKGKLVSNASLLPFRGTSAGGGYSTVGDLFRFAQALQSGKLLLKDILSEASREQSENYGYGFMVAGEGPTAWFGHGGGFPGMNGMLEIFPASGYVVIGLSNLDPPSVARQLDYFTLRMPITSGQSPIQ